MERRPQQVRELLEHVGPGQDVRRRGNELQECECMTQLQMVYTLRTGTQERWRRLSQEVAGSRRAQFEASCRQAGITQAQVWLVQLPHSELLLVKIDTQEPQQTLEALATSERPFERWLREQLQVLLGWNMQEMLPAPQGDLLLAWNCQDALLG